MTRPGSASTIVRWLSPVALAISVLSGSWGCFNPHVESGKLGCAPEGKECPDGFSCGAGNLCFKDGTHGSGGQGGTGGSAGTGGVSGSGGSAAPRQVGQTCVIRNEGQADQSDTCDVGLLCMSDCATARCYKTCDTDGDCPQSSCSGTNPTKTQRLCDVPYVSCNPMDMVTGGCGQGFGCWLLGPEPTATGADKTVCDCQAGSSGKGENCSVTRDCFKGLVCPPVGTGPGAGFCRQLCDQATGCQSGGTCRPFGAHWGYCF